MKIPFCLLVSLGAALPLLAPRFAASESCSPRVDSARVVYATALNSRLFFSEPSQVDSPVANPQALTTLVRPAEGDPDRIVFGVTLIDYTRGAKVYDADEIKGRFEIHVLPPPSAIAANASNVVIGRSAGAFFKDFVHNRPDLSGRVANLARVEIPAESLFRHLPTVDGEPDLALGTVLAVLRKPEGGPPIACSYMNPLLRPLASNRAAAVALTTTPAPFVIGGTASATVTEVVHVEPMNVTTRVGTTNYEIGLMANPPAIEGVATTPTNGGSAYDFALTFVRYDGKNGAPRVFTQGECEAPMNPYGVRRVKKGPAYSPQSRLKVRLRPIGQVPPAKDLVVEWNREDAIVLPLHDTANLSEPRFYCVARIRIPVCEVQQRLGPIPGLDRSIRIGLIEGLHVVSEGGVEVVKSGFFNRQNRLLVPNKGLAEVSSAIAQPVVFLVDPEPVCQPS